jgi:hypothetical protein
LQSATALKPGRCGHYENRVDLAIGTNLEQERDVEDDDRNPPAREGGAASMRSSTLMSEVPKDWR